MEEDVVEVYRASNPIEADMLVALLAEAGIETSTVRDGAYRLSTGPMAVTPISVHMADAERATELIESALRGDFALGGEEEEGEDGE